MASEKRERRLRLTVAGGGIDQGRSQTAGVSSERGTVMSTIPRRSRASQAEEAHRPARSHLTSFKYGWRDVTRNGPDGRMHLEELP